MPDIHEIADYLDTFLETRLTPDYPMAVNCLQFENRSEIRGIAAAVDFSSRAIDGVIAAGANLLVVHHGMFWGGAAPIKGSVYRRVRRLVEGDIAVYSSHLALDRHPLVGNNVLIAKELGLEPTASFARFDGIHIGVSGKSDMKTASLISRVEKFAGEYGGNVRTTPVRADRVTRRWAICTGSGASADTLKECEELNIDTLIVGEGPHWTAVHAEENELVIVHAGHYATETLGVRALVAHLGERYNLPFTFISAPTGL
jgi:dinuclear metal center YbgI/SA1388 family protein